MAQSYPDVVLNSAWKDLTLEAGLGGIANQKVTIQAKGGNALVYFGGAAAPTGSFGVDLSKGQSATGTTDHLWVKGSWSVAVLVED